jgi:hypothetical protein
MISLTQYLKEDKEGKNLHLEHIEDEVLNGGVKGTRGAINFLISLRNMLSGKADKSGINLTTKWDGAPAVFAGINPENKKFFVGTKGVFAKNAKLNYTNADIDKNHPSEGLNKKLKIALLYLSKLGISNVIQGDMMFTREDIKTENIDGEDYIVFQPNTIAYAVPANSALAKTIMNAKLGIVWHTSYDGPSLQDMRASFNIDIAKLNQTKDVWFRDASYIDAAGTATFTMDETEKLSRILTTMGSLFRTISARTLNEIAESDYYRTQIKAFNNTKVRQGQKITNTAMHVRDMILHIEAKLNENIAAAKKSDTRLKREKEKSIILRFLKTNKDQLKLILDLQNLMVDAKLMVVRKLEQVKSVPGTFIRTDDGFKVTAPEGFVAVDRISGSAVKLVDRLTFSFNNFTAAKAWTTKV